MPIINQNLDSSEKKRDYLVNIGAFATGVTNSLGLVEYDSLLVGVNMAAFGLSGAPVYSLNALRLNSSGGITSIGLGATLTPPEYGTSGPLGFSLAAPGITLIAGDVLVITSGAANTAVASATLKVVLQALSDIRVYQNTVS